MTKQRILVNPLMWSRFHQRKVEILIVVTAVLCLLPSVKGQSSNSKPPDGNAPGITFTIRTKDGKTKFQQGELITIEMLFSSSVPDIYQVSGATYDRSGRFEADIFHIDPEVGVADPTAEYFNSALFGFMGGGLYPFPLPPLGEKPYVIPRDLNELVRFDRRGHYLLSVSNSRVGRIVWHGRSKAIEPVPTTSNTIELEILPADPVWQKEKIQEALATLNDSKSDTRPACRTLRFLNSGAAETEMIRRYRGSTNGCDGEFHLGLIGSPRRTAIIREMDARITAPDHPVTASFIHTLSALTYLNEQAGPLPPCPTNDQEEIKLWQAELQKRRNHFQEIVTGYAREMATAVSRKDKPARAVTIETLLEVEAGLPPEQRTAESDSVLSQVEAALPDLFLDLPAERQYVLLSSFWKGLAGPPMLPVLRQLIDKPPTERNSFEDLRSLALRRLFEIAPDEGRLAILREMRRTPLRVRMSALDILPDTALPEFDEMLKGRLSSSTAENNFDVVAQYSHLIARYASDSVFASIKTAAADKIGRMACDTESALLAYFLRVDPDYGAAAFKQALESRKDTGCYRMEFDQVGRLFMSARLEEIAVEHLGDRDRDVAIQAVGLLGRHGSAAAEKPLWNRFEQWHSQWQGREAEAQPQIENGLVAGEPAQFEVELVKSLARATAWVADLDKLKRMDRLCLTPAGRREVQSAVREWGDHSIHIFFDQRDTTPQMISVGQYQPDSISRLKEKLAQMPKGSTFVWYSTGADAQTDEELFKDLRRFLAGLDIELNKPDK